MNIPQDLDHLDAYSPEELNNLIIQEILEIYPDLNIIQACINAGASLDDQDIYRWTSLQLAASKGRLEVVKMLIAAGAALDAKDYLAQTALHLAVNSGHLEVVNALITSGASLDAKDHLGRTPRNILSIGYGLYVLIGELGGLARPGEPGEPG